MKTVNLSFRFCMIFGLLANLSLSGLWAENWKLDPARSNVTFTVLARTGAVTGSFQRLRAENFTIDRNRPESALGRIIVAIGSLQSGNAIRDRALLGRDFFAADRFPAAVANIKNITIVDEIYLADIELQIKGITKSIGVPISLEKDEDAIVATGRIQINRKDFNINGSYPSNPITNDVITLTFVFTFIPQ